MPAELVEPFQRSMTAYFLIERANRFLILRQPAEACKVAMKAWVIYPLSVYVYDCACVLESAGNPAEAKLMFAEFLRRHKLGPLNNALDEITMRRRDLDSMVQEALRKTS
jgi:hypothetical protein